MKPILLLFLTLFSVDTLQSQVLSLRDQAAWRDSVLDKRLTLLLPDLMERASIDVWVIIGAEYNEDPVLKTMLPATWLNARRTTMLVIAKNRVTGAIDRLAVARYDVGRSFKSAWNPDTHPDQFKRLAELISSYQPERIGINTSQHFDHANGITYTEHARMMEALPEALRRKVVSAEALAVGWLETRIPDELTMYAHINETAHGIIQRALSNEVVVPDSTTTTEVQWWLRETVRSMGLDVWFHPSVSVQRGEAPEHAGDFSTKPGEEVIRRGDLMHIDFGITYLGLNTDTQRMVYVLKDGESEIPAGLVAAFKKGNRLQDVLTGNFETGRPGNEVLKRSREQAIAEGLRPSIYTHPIGFHGHAAGATIGMWDAQGGVPGDGDYPVYPNACWSIELNVTEQISEWGKDVRIMLEEDACFDGSVVRYIAGRQESLYVVR
jgi:Xaa-Pro aminopeptidase